MLGVDQALEQQLRIDVGDDAGGRDDLAIVENDAGGAPGLDLHARDRRAGAQRDAARLAFGGHRLR